MSRRALLLLVQRPCTMARRRRIEGARSLSTTNMVDHGQSTSGSSNGRRGDTEQNHYKKRRTTECSLRRRPRHHRKPKSMSDDIDNDDNDKEKDEDSVKSMPCLKNLRSLRCRSSNNVRDCEDDDEEEEDTPSLASTAVSSTSSSSTKVDVHSLLQSSSSTSSLCLPRQVESKILKDPNRNVRFVVGVDEAGRGPLAGPVVAAAVIVPTLHEKNDDENRETITFDPFLVEGVVDSKKITKEEDREVVYQRLMEIGSHNNNHNGVNGKLRWAVAVIDAARIDEINILQATMEGMRAAVLAVMGLEATTVDLEAIQSGKQKKKTQHSKTKSTITVTTTSAKKSTRTIRRANLPSIVEPGCYVVCSDPPNYTCNDDTVKCNPEDYYAIIDGNRLPHDMPCQAESLLKGDSKEFCIAAASILAKVTRDRLMHGYSKLYPNYDLHQHKGYPTAAHMSAVRQFGASPIHRRTFAPLKHMSFDDQGKVIED